MWSRSNYEGNARPSGRYDAISSHREGDALIMSIRKYLGSTKRFIVVCLILARQLLINLPYRLIFVPRPKSRKAIGKYLKTRGPKISAPVIAKETLEKLGRNMVREMEKSSVNVAYGLLIAALVVFAPSVSNESAFERWLKSVFHLPIVPILSIVSLAAAGICG